jgi:hypothetical protein
MDIGMPLIDITNTQPVKNKYKRRKSDGTLTCYEHNRKVRKTVDFHVDNEAGKLAFESQFDRLKQSVGAKSNTELMQKMMEHFDQNKNPSPMTDKLRPESRTDTSEDYFICSKSQVLYLLDICNGLGPLHCNDYTKIGHVGQFLLKGSKTFLFWNSSPSMKEDFTINYKMIHAYLCSGMTPVQYERITICQYRTAKFNFS